MRPAIAEGLTLTFKSYALMKKCFVPIMGQPLALGFILLASLSSVLVDMETRLYANTGLGVFASIFLLPQFIQIARGEKPVPLGSKQSFKLAWKFAVLSLLVGLLIFVSIIVPMGMMLVFVDMKMNLGRIAMVALSLGIMAFITAKVSMASVFLITQDIEVMEAIKKSSRATMGHIIPLMICLGLTSLALGGIMTFAMNLILAELAWVLAMWQIIEIVLQNFIMACITAVIFMTYGEANDAHTG